MKKTNLAQFVKFIFIYFSFLAQSQSALIEISQYNDNKISSLSLLDLAFNNLEYSINTQIQESGSIYVKGEFPTQISSSLVPSLVGVGKAFTKDEEASAFTTAAVSINLAQIYLENPIYHKSKSFKRIPEVLDLASQSYVRYSENETYNFYPPIKLENGQSARRPKDMTLFPIWYGFTNIPNDSDTSSNVLSSLILKAKIKLENFKISQKALDTFSKFRDIDRNPMFYNWFLNQKNTHAYMTWFLDEQDQKMPRFFFASTEKGARIPFIKNDVDCIVNTNILKMLALNQTFDSELSKASCDYLNEVIENDQMHTCGVYYPNTYYLPYAVSNLKKYNNSCVLNSSKKLLLDKILSEQNTDGSWTNVKNTWNDPIISTAFAVYSLIELGNLNDFKVRATVFYGVHYLLKNVKVKNQRFYWSADHFFTATAIARSLIMWESEAYTNTIIASILFKMHHLYPQYKAQNYLQMKL